MDTHKGMTPIFPGNSYCSRESSVIYNLGSALPFFGIGSNPDQSQALTDRTKSRGLLELTLNMFSVPASTRLDVLNWETSSGWHKKAHQ